MCGLNPPLEVEGVDRLCSCEKACCATCWKIHILEGSSMAVLCELQVLYPHYIVVDAGSGVLPNNCPKKEGYCYVRRQTLEAVVKHPSIDIAALLGRLLKPVRSLCVFVIAAVPQRCRLSCSRTRLQHRLPCLPQQQIPHHLCSLLIKSQPSRRNHQRNAQSVF